MSQKYGKLVSPMDEIEDSDSKNDAMNVESNDSSEEKSSSSEEEEGEDLDAVERRTIELKNSLTSSPFVYEHHVELIKCLEKIGELEQLRQARKHMHELYPLTEELWLKWLRDEVKYCEDKSEIVSLFDAAVKDYLSVKIWLEYCQYAIGAFLADSTEKVRSVLDRALAACGNHVISGNIIWEVSRLFEQELLQGLEASQNPSDAEGLATQKERVNSLFKAQLSVPLFEMQSTYDEYCEWLGGEPDKATKVAYDRALEFYENRKLFEEKLLESDPPSLDAYTSYLIYEEEQGDPTRVSCLYERAIVDHPLAEELWRHYTAFLERKILKSQSICDLYERAVRNVPWLSELWVKWAQALERLGSHSHEKISKVFEDALAAGFQKESDVVQVWVAYLDYLRRRINWREGHDAELSDLRSCFSRAEEAMNGMQERRDHLPTVLKYRAFVEAKYCENVEKARELWHMVTRLGRGNQAELWLEYVAFERAFGESPNSCIAVLQSALNAVVDRPEAICAAYINFAREACSLEQLDEAIVACEKRSSLLKKRAKEQANRENNKAAGNGSKHAGFGFHKGKGQGSEQNAGKEAYSGAPAFVKPGQKFEKKQQDKVAKYQSPVVDGGDRGAKRKFERQPPPAEQELAEGESPFKKPAPLQKNQAAVFKEPTIPPPPSMLSSSSSSTSAQSSQFKQDINFSDDNPTTVFLSNLDYNVTEEEVRQFFKNCGAIEEVRLVMKAQNLNRGFAYIKFADVTTAKKSLELDRQKIRNRPAYVSPYSDKKSQAGEKKSGLIYAAALEKNKLFVRGVPLSCTEAALKAAFAAHGPLKAARLVTFKDGNPKGMAYVEFETADAAEKARQATNGTAALGEGNILTVEISNPPPKRAPGEVASSSASVRKGTVAAFYSNLGVGSRHQGQGQLTRIEVPAPSAQQSTSTTSSNGNGTSEPAKMKNDEFRRFLK